MAWRIKNWELLFENAESRKTKSCRWVAVPNKHDGGGYGRVARHPRNIELFCAWNLLLQVASKMPVRGLLYKDGVELDSEDLHTKTQYPAEIFDLAFKVLSSPKIDWIECVNILNPSGKNGMASGQAGPEGNGREGNGREEDSNEPADAVSLPPAVDPVTCEYPIFPCRLGRRSREVAWTLSPDLLGIFVANFTEINVDQECRKAWTWVRCNPTKAKTFTGMPDFIRRWLSRATTFAKRRPNASTSSTYTPAEQWVKNPVTSG